MMLSEYLERHELAEWISVLQNYSECSVGWGRKKSFFKAEDYAKKHGLKALCLEDGFIRSLGLGKDGYPPLSLVIDDVGIYFDATQQSKLETLIFENEDVQFNNRAKNAINQIIEYGITKYNQKFEAINLPQFSNKVKNILVIDQTYGDQSIKYAGANEDTFKGMLRHACTDHPEAQIWVKIHPDVLAGRAKSHYSEQDLNHPRIKVITSNFNPIELLQQVDEVYVVSSQMGFEALFCEKKVHCFGVPWYAGWGLTNDRYAPLHILKGRRNVHRSLLHLFACAYLKYARYIDPIHKKTCELEELLTSFVSNIEAQRRIPNKISAYGFSLWKKGAIRRFLNFPGTQINFYSWKKPSKQNNIIAWGRKAHLLKKQGYTNVITVEDGFIRSVGLGAELVQPSSLVFDDIGIYYDATRPSRLENLLKSRSDLSRDELIRVERLIQQLISLNITKYNVGVEQLLNRPINGGKVILVVGQVEDDMSIQLGGVSIKTNIGLLREVRLSNPDAFIIYKPHPDVVAGLRIGKIPDDILTDLVDQIEREASILDCFKICDELHTISSLSGFEALIRGIPVYCYGLPFYAGWGLTIDKFICSRRNVKLNLEKFVYCTLIEYPFYNLSCNNFVPNISPEHVIQHLVEIKNDKKTMPKFKFIKFLKSN